MPFTVIYPEYTPSIDLDAVERTYRRLEDAHQQTINTLSTSKAAIAALDLNAEEDAWRQEQIARLDNAMSDMYLYGNAYAAADELNKMIGDIASDPGMIGRVRAQQQYKQWETNLDKSNLNDKQKAYFKAMNKYHYQDITDDTGRVVGGTDWTPQVNYVNNVDIGALMARATQIAAADASGSDIVYYKDASGKWTTNIDNSVDGLPYYKINGQYEVLSKDKVRLALDTVIQGTPGALDSINQNYNIDKWYSDKGDASSKMNIIGKDGKLLTRNQYIERMLDGFANVASYSKSSTTMTPLAGMSVAAMKERNKRTSMGDFNKSLYDVLNDLDNTSFKGNLRSEPDATINGVSATRNAAIQRVANIAAKYDIPWDNNNVNAGFEALINDGRLTSEEYNVLYEYELANNVYQNLIEQHPEIKNPSDYTSAIDAGVSMIDTGNNPYITEHNRIINQLFKGQDKIEIETTKDALAIQKELASKGIDINSLGLEVIQTEDGRHALYMNYDYADKVGKAYDAIKEYTYNTDITVGDYGRGMIGPNVNFAQYNAFGRAGQQINDLYKRASNDLNKSLSDEDYGFVQDDLYSFDSVVTGLAQERMKQNMLAGEELTASDYNNYKKMYTDMLSTFGNVTDKEMTIGTGVNAETPINEGAAKQAIMQLIRMIQDGNVKGSVGRNVKTDMTKEQFDVQIFEDDNLRTNNTYKRVIDELNKYGIKIGKEGMYRFTLTTDPLYTNQAMQMIYNNPEFTAAKDMENFINAGATEIPFNRTKTTIQFNKSNGQYTYTNPRVTVPEPIDKREAVRIAAGDKILSYAVNEYLQRKRNNTPLSTAEENYFASKLKQAFTYLNPGLSEEQINAITLDYITQLEGQ